MAEPAGTLRDFPQWAFITALYPGMLNAWQGRFAEAAAEFGQLPLPPPPFDAYVAAQYGSSQALAGDYDGAVTTLQTHYQSFLDLAFDLVDADAIPALVWSHLQLGAEEKAQAILSEFDRKMMKTDEQGLLNSSQALFILARNTLLMGDRGLALQRLEQAVDTGWRDYHIQKFDPLWAELHDDPRYQALMEKVRADIERQRAEVERLDAEEDFKAVVDAARAQR